MSCFTTKITLTCCHLFNSVVPCCVSFSKADLIFSCMSQLTSFHHIDYSFHSTVPPCFGSRVFLSLCVLMHILSAPCRSVCFSMKSLSRLFRGCNSCRISVWSWLNFSACIDIALIVFHILVLQEYQVLVKSRIPLKPVLRGIRIAALSISSHDQTQ